MQITQHPYIAKMIVLLYPKRVASRKIYRRYIFAAAASAMSIHQALSLCLRPNDGYWGLKLGMMIMAMLWLGHGTTLADRTLILLNAFVVAVCATSLLWFFFGEYTINPEIFIRRQ